MPSNTKMLDIVGIIVILIGIAMAGYVLDLFIKAGIFDNRLSVWEILIVVAILFYHFVIGNLCFSVSKLRKEINKEVNDSHKNNVAHSRTP